MRIAAFTLLLALSSVVPFHDARSELTLQMLAKQCEGLEPKPSQPMIGQLMCMSYLAGALDQIILVDGLAVINKEQPKSTLCVSPEVSKVEQLSAVVRKVATDYPEKQHESARAVVRGLIFGLYGCKDETP